VAGSAHSRTVTLAQTVGMVALCLAVPRMGSTGQPTGVRALNQQLTILMGTWESSKKVAQGQHKPW